MNKRLLLMMLVCINAYAEPDSLPPIEDNSSYYGGTNYPTQAPAAVPSGGAVGYNNRSSNTANGMYEVLGQLEQLQKEVRQLSGTVEEQAHELADVKKKQKKLLDDMDQRIQALESSKTAEPPSPAPAPVTAPEVSAPAPAINAAATPAPPAPKVEAPVLVPTPSKLTDETFPKQIYPAPKPVVVAPVVKPGEKEQYQQAYDTLRDGHYTKAIASFNSLLQTYPNGEYSANAQYWLGEAYKVNQDISSAREAFTKVVSNYPTSPKVPDALLKLGYMELEQNNIAKAKDYLNKVSTGYPNTTAAHLASKKLMALNGGSSQ